MPRSARFWLAEIAAGRHTFWSSWQSVVLATTSYDVPQREPVKRTLVAAIRSRSKQPTSRVDTPMWCFDDGRVPPEPHLHNSGFKVGTTPTMMMNITGRLAVDELGCVFATDFGSADGVGILWPDDYAARVGQQGMVEVVDLDGQVVVQQGDAFNAGGGFGDGQLAPDCAVRHPEFVVIGTVVRRIDAP